MYNRTITIQFYFPLDSLGQSIHLEAQATLYREFCLVYGFKTLNDSQIDHALSKEAGIPRMILHPIEKEGRVLWVHKDSGKKTIMSEIVGLAIEEALHKEMRLQKQGQV